MAISMNFGTLYEELAIPPDMMPGECFTFTPIPREASPTTDPIATVSWARDLEGGRDLIEAVAFTSGDVPEELMSAVFEVGTDGRVTTVEVNVNTMSPEDTGKELDRLATFMREFRGLTAGLKREKVSAS